MATLKQSTAYTRMFLLVQSSDHITGLAGASPTVTLSKAGGAFGAAGGSVTEVSSGWYKIALTTTDTNTLGDLAYHITATSGDPSDFADQVTANILGDTLPANTTQLAGQTVTAAAGVTFPTSVASPTNITAGTITTVTNLTNAPTSGDLTATMKTSVTTAATAATPTAAAVTGNVGGNVVGSVGSVVGAVGSVTGNVGGNVTGSVGSVASGGIAAASFAANAINAAALATDAVNEIADGLLNRDMSTGTDSGSDTVRTPRQALFFLRNKWVASGGTLTVYKVDDATASWTSTLSTDGSAAPIVSSDPAGP